MTPTPALAEDLRAALPRPLPRPLARRGHRPTAPRPAVLDALARSQKRRARPARIHRALGGELTAV